MRESPTATGRLLAVACLVLALTGAVTTAAGVRLVPGSAGSGAASLRAGDLHEAPEFCHDLDCPTYVVSSSIAPNVEERAYEGAKWVSTNVTGASYDEAVRKGFWRLFKYIGGENAAGAKIEMTAPVRVKVLPGPGPTCEDTFIISFFVPFALQEDPPAPTNKAVYVSHTCATSYFVLTYPGFTYESKVLARAQELLQVLDEHGIDSYDYSHFFSAGYDSPFRLLNRHNEIWLPAKSAKRK